MNNSDIRRAEYRQTHFQIKRSGVECTMLDKIALILTVIGGINWGSVGIFGYDIVANLFGGSASLVSRIIYTVIAVASLWCLSFFFRSNDCGDHMEV